MIKILKTDDTYRRNKEYVSFSFLDCTKITTDQTSRLWKDITLTNHCLINPLF